MNFFFPLRELPLKRRRALLFLSYVLLLAGSLALGSCLYVWTHAELFQNGQLARLAWLRAQFMHSGARRLAYRKGDLIGRLEIPRLGLSAVVVEGDDAATLRLAAGHIPGTAAPGQTGNFAIAAHRDTLFHALKNIRRNDLLQFESVSGTYRYRVRSVAIVPPNDVAVLRPGDVPELTLITCYPFSYIRPAPKRFVVRANLIASP